MSEKTYVARIPGIGFSALQIEQDRWSIITNPLPGETQGYCVSEVFRGDGDTARTVLREWGDIYLKSRPHPGETMRRTAAMATYTKKPIVISARQIKRRITVETLEGPVTGESGQWLITGVAGERYPCNDQHFRANYAPVRPTKGGDFPTRGRFRKLPALVEAEQLLAPEIVVTAAGHRLSGNAGDWKLTNGTDTWICANSIFLASYERADVAA